MYNFPFDEKCKKNRFAHLSSSIKWSHIFRRCVVGRTFWFANYLKISSLHSACELTLLCTLFTFTNRIRMGQTQFSSAHFGLKRKNNRTENRFYSLSYFSSQSNFSTFINSFIWFIHWRDILFFFSLFGNRQTINGIYFAYRSVWLRIIEKKTKWEKKSFILILWWLAT